MLSSDTAYAQFILELGWQDTRSNSKSRSSSIAEKEINSYQQELEHIQQESIDAEQRIAALKEELTAAQRHRRNRIEYDAIATEALKLPSRAHASGWVISHLICHRSYPHVIFRSNITRLQNELQELEAEHERYTSTWTARQTAFSDVVKSLEELTATITEEKAEQERREAMLDNDEMQPEEGEEVGGQHDAMEEDEAS